MRAVDEKQEISLLWPNQNNIEICNVIKIIDY